MVDIVTNVVGPVIVLVLLGALTGPRLAIDAGQLSRLAYWVLGPAFMFDALARAELEGSVVLRLGLVSAVAMGAAGLVAWGSGTALRQPGAVQGAMVMSSAYGNVGNAGLAISIFALGEGIKPAASVVMLVVNTVGVVLGVGMASRQRGGGITSALVTALAAPMTLAALAAVGFSFANSITTVELPTLIDRVITILAGALIPMMLYTLGVQLMNQGKPQFSSSVGAVSASKLVAAPLAAGVAAGAVGLTGDFASVAVIQSAMPPAVFTAVVAMEHSFEVENVTTYLVTASLLALVTVPAVLAII